MTISTEIVGYFHWTFLLVSILTIRSSNGFQIEFFRFADREKPHFYLTQEEIINAMHLDETWKKEAEELKLLELMKRNRKWKARKGGKGLDMETFNVAMMGE